MIVVEMGKEEIDRAVVPHTVRGGGDAAARVKEDPLTPCTNANTSRIAAVP